MTNRQSLKLHISSKIFCTRIANVGFTLVSQKIAFIFRKTFYIFMHKTLQNIVMTPLLTGNPAYQLNCCPDLAEQTHRRERDV
jgi:hypothetical protein